MATKPDKARIGRPPGKRSDPNYRQIKAHVLREAYEDVPDILWTKYRRRGVSDLLDELLDGWRTRNR